MKRTIAVFALALLSCGGTEISQPLAEVEDRQVRRTPEGDPVAPEEFRKLWTVPNAEASRLFELISDQPGDIEAREQLAALYREEGYLSAGSFLEATTNPLREEIVVFKAPWNPIAWGVGGQESFSRLKEDSGRALEICALSQNNRHQDAIDKAYELLAEGPYSAAEVGAWSYAALQYIIADAGPVQDSVPEMAFRVFLTSLEEGLPPECTPRRASGHWLISVFFQHRGDPVSAYTAAAIEQELLNRPSHSDIRSDYYEESLQERIEQLQSELAKYLDEDT